MCDSRLHQMLNVVFINCLPDNNPFRGGYEALHSQFKHFLSLPYEIKTGLELEYFLNSILHDSNVDPLIIHVFCHSNQSGIWSDQIGQHLLMTWEAFIKITNQINTKRHNGLTVLVTGCESYNAITATSSSRTFIGYKNEVHYEDAHAINSFLYAYYALKGCTIIDSAIYVSSKYPDLVIVNN